MPNRVTGSTEVISGAAALPGGNKMVYVIGGRGISQPSQDENVPFDVISTADAADKWGSGAPAIDVVKTLISLGVSQIRGVRTRKPGVQSTELLVEGTVTTSGNASSVVTAAGMTGSPVTVTIAVSAGDTAEVVAGKMRAALKANANVAAFFEISGRGNRVVLTAKTAAANDNTMNFTLAVGTSAGLTPVTTSDNTPPVAEAQTYDDALDSLAREDHQQAIIVVDTDSDVPHAAIISHLTTAEADDKFRYAVIGMTPGASNPEYTLRAATFAASKRVFMVGPNPIDANGIPVKGYIAAAAFAAKLAIETSDPALPLNGVTFDNGFSGVERVLASVERSAFITAGITPLVGINGVPSIYRAVTCSSDATWKEVTTVMIADYVLISVMDRIKANYKRTKNVVRILNAMRTDVIDVLDTINGLEIIENFDPKTVVVSRDPSDTYGALISYDFDVVTPLYTVTITQRMKV